MNIACLSQWAAGEGETGRGRRRGEAGLPARRGGLLVCVSRLMRAGDTSREKGQPGGSRSEGGSDADQGGTMKRCWAFGIALLALLCQPTGGDRAAARPLRPALPGTQSAVLRARVSFPPQPNQVLVGLPQREVHVCRVGAGDCGAPNTLPPEGSPRAGKRQRQNRGRCQIASVVLFCSRREGSGGVGAIGCKQFTFSPRWVALISLPCHREGSSSRLRRALSCRWEGV